MARMDRVEFGADQITVAELWHGGMTSMLYEIASTGALSRGTIRPSVDCDDCDGRGWHSPSERCRACRGAKMTDEQWLAHRASKLESEATERARHARTQARRARRAQRRADRAELLVQASVLDGIAAKCRAAIAALTTTGGR